MTRGFRYAATCCTTAALLCLAPPSIYLLVLVGGLYIGALTWGRRMG
jgi:hypothetical protein